MCDATAGTAFLFANGFGAVQTWTAATAASGVCACAAPAAGRVVTLVVTPGGAQLNRCVTCPAGTAPNAGETACVSTAAAAFATTPQQDLQAVVTALSLGINVGAATEVGVCCLLARSACRALLRTRTRAPQQP